MLEDTALYRQTTLVALGREILDNLYLDHMLKTAGVLERWHWGNWWKAEIRTFCATRSALVCLGQQSLVSYQGIIIKIDQRLALFAVPLACLFLQFSASACLPFGNDGQARESSKEGSSTEISFIFGNSGMDGYHWLLQETIHGSSTKRINNNIV